VNRKTNGVQQRANPPPRAAPINNDGEKIPPEEPIELIVVANALQAPTSASSQNAEICPASMPESSHSRRHPRSTVRGCERGHT